MHPDLLAAWHQVRSDPRSAPAVLTSWRGVRDTGVLSLRDPGLAATLVRVELRTLRRPRHGDSADR